MFYTILGCVAVAVVVALIPSAVGLIWEHARRWPTGGRKGIALVKQSDNVRTLDTAAWVQILKDEKRAK